jgi:hypothetical protein
MTIRRTRAGRLAAATAVTAATLTGALAAAGPASAYTPCPPDICDPPVEVVPKKWPFPGPNPCLACPPDRFRIDVRDLIITERLDQVGTPLLERELVLDVPRGIAP